MPDQIQIPASLLKSVLAPIFQPGAQLQQTQAQVPLTQQETQTSAQSQQTGAAEQQNIQAQVPETQAQAQVAAQKAQANNFVNSTKNTFEELKNKLGYVPPDVYNHYQQTKPVGLSDSDFESNFAKSFTDPNQQYNYNTSQGIALKQQRSNLVSQLTSGVNSLTQQFNSFNGKGSIENELYNNPLYKAIGMGGSQRTFEQNKAATIASLQTIAKNPNLAALGIKQEDVNKLIANLPDVGDQPEDTQSKMTQLQSALGSLGTKATKAENPGLVSQGAKLLQTLAGQAINPAIDATNQVEKTESNPANKGNLLNSVLSAGKATGEVGATAASQIPSDVVASLAGQAPGIATGMLGKVFSPLTKGASDGAMPFAQKFIKYLGTTQNKTGDAIQEAAGKGGAVDWNTVVANAKEQMANKGVVANKALDRLINQESPAQLGNAQLTSPEALELRKGLGSRLPNNFFETALQKASTGKNVQNNQAIQALRGALSDELKRAAPDIKGPDEMYTFIKTMKGDAPTWAKRIAAGAATDYATKKLGLQGPASDLMSVLAGGAAGL